MSYHIFNKESHLWILSKLKLKIFAHIEGIHVPRVRGEDKITQTYDRNDDLITRFIYAHSRQVKVQLCKWMLLPPFRIVIRYSLISSIWTTHTLIKKYQLSSKIKNFFWRLVSNAIIVQEILVKRHISGDVRCNFCQKDETIKHYLLLCDQTFHIWLEMLGLIKIYALWASGGGHIVSQRSACKG